jgi:phosphocarrier protein HPr
MSESCEVTITLAGDLHARPAGALAVAAARFSSAVELSAGIRSADARSVLAIMGLGAVSGQQVRIRATGPDAGDATAALADILARATVVGS